MRVSVVGLGAMGKAIAANLVKAGVSTTVWNRSPEPAAALVALGATKAAAIAEAFRCDIVLSTLFDDAAVRSVILDTGVLAAAAAGTIHVCMSTISTDLALKLVEAHGAGGAGYVAAPMFGRPDAAAAAKLNIVTAGPPDLLDRVEPVLGELGRTWRMGDSPPLGHLAKLAGNFMIGCAIEAMAESAALVSSQGNPNPFLAMMAETLFAAPIYRLYGPWVGGSVAPGAPSGLQLPLKDISLTLNEARAARVVMPLAHLLQSRLQAASREGLTDEDWSTALSKVARGGGAKPRLA